MLRQDMNLDDATSTTDRAWTTLDPGMVREELEDRLLHDRDGLGFLQVNNLFPNDQETDRQTGAFFGDGSKGIATSPQLEEALAAAERFCEALGARKRGAGYI